MNKWIQEEPYSDWVICSACGRETNIVQRIGFSIKILKYQYCPYCGEKMGKIVYGRQEGSKVYD